MIVDPALKEAVAFAIRRATAADAQAIVAILEGIASERIYNAINKPWPGEEQRQHIVGLSAREAILVAEDAGKAIIAYQTLELWASTFDSMGARWSNRNVCDARMAAPRYR